MKVITKHTSNGNGRGGVLATTTVDGKRRQHTEPWDHSKSREDNHGKAAATLLVKVFPNKVWKTDEVLGATYSYTDDGRHVFNI